MTLLPKRDYCTLDEDWATGASFVGQDQLMQFTTQGIHPKLPAGIQVSSLKQWDKIQKQYGVTADVSLKERVQRRTSGLAQRIKQERQAAFQQRIRPIVEQGLRHVRG